MDDLRYQVDMLTASNRTYAANEKIYKLICEKSNRAFIYYQPSSNSFKTFGLWSDFFDFQPTEFSDFTRILELADDSMYESLRRLFYIEKENKDDEILVVKLKDLRVVEVHSMVFYGEQKNVDFKLISFGDITQKANYKDELMYMAYYDFMTGLYNRNYFIQNLTKFIEKAKKENLIVSIMIIDIDEFHKINDGLGLLLGDEVIQNFGIYLKSLITDEDIIGSRFDGDMYALAIYDTGNLHTVEKIYSTINERLKKPFLLTSGSEVSFSVSVGVSEYPEASENPLELINSAEIVMLKAKENGRGDIRFFDSALLDTFMHNIEIEKKLSNALQNDQFFLNYQPQYFADNKMLRGVEALIRWRDDEGKLIGPYLFIPIAEKTGRIIEIGDWVMQEAIRQYMEWKRKFDVDFILSINISAVQFKRSDFVTKVISTLESFGMKAQELELELTESVLIDDFNTVVEKLDELRDFGIKISMDDFGTGFSSLQYLKGLPLDTLKIDKSFVDTIIEDKSSKAIAETIVELSRKLEYEIIAEGVETNEQYEYLKEIDCEVIQGYLLGKPVSQMDIEELLLRMI